MVVIIILYREIENERAAEKKIYTKNIIKMASTLFWLNAIALCKCVNMVFLIFFGGFLCHRFELARHTFPSEKTKQNSPKQ